MGAHMIVNVAIRVVSAYNTKQEQFSKKYCYAQWLLWYHTKLDT